MTEGVLFVECCELSVDSLAALCSRTRMIGCFICSSLACFFNKQEMVSLKKAHFIELN